VAGEAPASDRGLRRGLPFAYNGPTAP